MAEGPDEGQEAKRLIARCLEGNFPACQEFQDRYGPLIYGYPSRVYRTGAELAGDFYVYVFEDGRIYRRLQSYEGRAPLRAFLLGFVLDALFIDWRRAQRGIETVSLDEPSDVAQMASAAPADSGNVTLDRLLADIEPGKAVVMKLLHVEDAEFHPEEVQYLARTSGRSVRDILTSIESLREGVRVRESSQQELEDSLQTVQAWIQLYEHRLRGLRDGSSSLAAREECAELERKIARRCEQRDRLLGRLKAHKITVPYKDIAVLLNTSIGNVGSQISRLKQELQQRGRPEL